MDSRLALVVALSLVAAACGGEAVAPADAGADTARPADTALPPADTAGPDAGVRCCPLGNCPVGFSCTQGACLPAAAAGQCYLDGQCGEGQVCVGATRCACGEGDCAPAPGACAFPAGCCNGDADCAAAGEVCVAGQCRATPADRCWRDGQCSGGAVCEGEVACAWVAVRDDYIPTLLKHIHDMLHRLSTRFKLVLNALVLFIFNQAVTAYCNNCYTFACHSNKTPYVWYVYSK